MKNVWNLMNYVKNISYKTQKSNTMKIVEFLQKAQYSRITVGYRWMYARKNGFTVCERLPRKRTTIILGEEVTEDEAVKLLIEGEEAYSDLLENI